MIRRYLVLKYLAIIRKELLETLDSPRHYFFCHHICFFRELILNKLRAERIDNWGLVWFSSNEERLIALDKVINDIKNKK